MESFRIIDPKAAWREIAERASRPPNVTELRARAAAEIARLGVLLERRADQTECHYCAGHRSGLYREAPPGPCLSCGRTVARNGHDILASRHSLPKPLLTIEHLAHPGARILSVR